MEREEFDRLLAGYATNQLSQEETARLMEAAMADQALFNALADEDALRDTLADRQIKAELLQSLAPKEKASFWGFLAKPQIWALAGTAAVAALAFVFLIKPQTEPPKQSQIAQAPVTKPEAPPSLVQPAPAEAAPAPKVMERRAPAPQVVSKEVAPLREETAVLKKEVDALKDTRQEEAKTAPMAPAAPPPPPAAPEKAAPPAPRAAPSFRAADQAPAKMKGAATPLATLAYTVLRKNQQGEFVEAEPGAILTKGDTIRIAVTSRNRGYLSLTDSATNRQLYYGLADAGTRYVVPASGEVTLDAAGTEKRLRLALVVGPGGGGAQSQVASEQNFATGNAAGAISNQQLANGPLAQSSVEIVVRYK